MAEALGVAASVAGLVSLASELTKGCYTCYSYLKSTKQAREEVKQVIDELNDFRECLQSLERVYSKRTQPLTSTKAIIQNVKECSIDVEIFTKSLRPDFEGLRGVLERLKWPKEHEKVVVFIDKLQRYRGYFDSVKANDTLALADNAVTLAEKSVGVGFQVLDSTKNIERKLDEKWKKERWIEMLEWISHVNLDNLRNYQKELYSVRRQTNRSGTWILRDEHFNMWRHSTSHSYCSSLWSKGDPGSGKTITSSVIINLLSQKPDIPLVYFYCNYQDTQQQQPDLVFGSLLKQLLSGWFSYLSPPTEVELFYERGKKSAPPLARLQKLFLDLCAQQLRVHIVIDGVDELAPNSQFAMVKFFQLCSTARTVKTIFSSRPHLQQLEKTFRGLSVEIKPQVEDIRAMIKASIKANSHIQMIVDGDTTWEGRLVARILQKSAGQFLLAHLHLEQISLESTKADIYDSLNDLTSNLPAEYDRNFERILESPARSKLAIRVFSWLLAAQRPLHMEELCEALAISLHDDHIRKDRRPGKAIVLDSCLGLVRLNHVSDTVEFFHFTVKEHLMSRKEFQENTPVDIPRSCLTYLRFKDFSQRCHNSTALLKRKHQYPLCGYISEFWAHHVRGTPEEQLKITIIEFFQSENVFSSIQMLPLEARNARLIGRELDNKLYTQPTREMAVYLCTYFELKISLQMLLEEKVCPNMHFPCGEQYSSIHVAICYGDINMLQFLLNAGGDPNIQDRWGLTPSHLTARLQSSSEFDLFRVLLGHSPQLENVDQDDDTVLHFAVRYAKFESVRLLLNYGTNPNAKNKQGQRPLHLAVERRHAGVVESLLDGQADPTATNANGFNALTLALRLEEPVIVEMLLKSLDGDGNSHTFDTLDKAASEGFLEKLRDQLEFEKQKKAQCEKQEAETENHRRNRYCNATIKELLWAAEKGEHGRVRELVDGGADVNQRDPMTGKTALHFAIENERDNLAFWLLRAGADQTMEDASGKVPIDYVTDSSHWIRSLLPWRITRDKGNPETSEQTIHSSTKLARR